jgi:hypothetical protein
VDGDRRESKLKPAGKREEGVCCQAGGREEEKEGEGGKNCRGTNPPEAVIGTPVRGSPPERKEGKRD